MLSVTFSDQGFDHEIRSVQICEDNSITALSAAIDSAFTLWVFDTGSASTVCNNKDLFQSLSPLSTPLWLRGFDNNRTQVFAHGPINLSFRSSDGKPIYGTVDALHVPTLDWNSVPSHILEVLPSLHLLSTVNNMLLVDDEKESPFATFDKQSRTWFLQNGAYPDKSLETRRRETSEANLDFWHMLCNHAALSCVQQLQKFTQTPHQPSGRIQKPVDCPIGDAVTAGRATQRLFRLHADLSGPVDLVEGNGVAKSIRQSRSRNKGAKLSNKLIHQCTFFAIARVFLLVCDEATRYTWCLPLSTPSDASETLQKLINHLKNRYPEFPVS
ncbi:hypothetical protein DASB73_005060 [Starmerella bacillaris]|uniref:Retrovirus-related Pol polyprotein from transposon TNT 1-94-like beta-barrel domain-containing protein n=1 Tax=Starmerella bacillaris TaxID=1247836 RepID=A0AAV5RDL4_STABA|nr:hypothetical protein DASB73_005060 [Starmerella bacillaris]